MDEYEQANCRVRVHRSHGVLRPMRSQGQCELWQLKIAAHDVEAGGGPPWRPRDLFRQRVLDSQIYLFPYAADGLTILPALR